MDIKYWISNTLRKIGLLYTADKVRFYFVKFKNRKKNQQFKKDNPFVKIPPDYFLYETYTLSYADYYIDGKNTADEIIRLFSETSSIQKEMKVLDWGCGPGRITQHLDAAIPKAEIYATDYNPDYIAWCSTNIKNVRFSLNNIIPPLNYPDSFFDLIIGISLFTHFSEKGHIQWLNEVYRILKSGGIALITTQGLSYRRKLSKAEKQVFDKGHLVVRSYFSEGNRLFSAFQPTGFIERQIVNIFDVIRYIPGSAERAFEQDIWLLQKK